MTKYLNSFRGQPVGTSMSTANSVNSGAQITNRYGSGDPMSLVYDDAHVLQNGYRSVRTGTGTDLMYMSLKFIGDESTSVTAKFAVYFPVDFQFNPGNTNIMQMQYNAGANGGVLYLLSTGYLQFNTMTAGVTWTSVKPVALGHWYTFELFTVVGLSTNDGVIEVQYFIDGSQVPAEPPYRNHIARTNVSAAGVNSLACGKVASSTVPQVMYIGPMYVNSRATGLEGAFPPPTWTQWNGTAEMPLIFKPLTVANNLATNPAYENGTNSILTGSTGTYLISTDTTAPITGTRSALFTRAGTLTPTIAQILGTVAGNKFSVTPGQVITGAMSIKTDVAGSKISTRWYWYDSSGTLTVGTMTDRVLNVVAGQVYRVAETGIALSDSATAYFVVTVTTASGNAVAGQRVWADQLLLQDSISDGTYFDGSTPSTPQMRYAWTGGVNLSGSTATPVTVTNLVPNPGYEVGNSCFGTNNGTLYPVAGDTSQPIAGTRSAMTTRTATSPSNTAMSCFFGPPVGKYSVTAGIPVTWAITCKSDTDGMKFNGWLYWYDAGNVNIGRSSTVISPAIAPGVTYRMVVKAVPPASATQCWGAMTAGVPGVTDSTGQKCWMDLQTFENADTDGSYFDGNTPSTPSMTYNWTGTANASASTATALTGVWNGASVLQSQTTVGMV